MFTSMQFLKLDPSFLPAQTQAFPEQILEYLSIAASTALNISDAGYCILLFSPDLSSTAKARLRAIRNTTDGFAIAQNTY